MIWNCLNEACLPREVDVTAKKFIELHLIYFLGILILQDNLLPSNSQSGFQVRD